jgi:hypothetical protein
MNQIFTKNISSMLEFDFKHSDQSFDYEYAIHNQNKERVLKDISTDVFIDYVFSDKRNNDNNENNEERSKNRFNFLTYVYNYLKFKLDIELQEKLCEEGIVLDKDENVYLIFKGGSMMYYLYEKLISFLRPDTITDFRNTFDDKFKVSDFDFTIYITVKNPKTFYRVKLLVNKIILNGLQDIRKFFEDYSQLTVLDNMQTDTLLLGVQDENESTVLKHCLKIRDERDMDTNNKQFTLKRVEDLHESLSKILIMEDTQKKTDEQMNLSVDFYNNRNDQLARDKLLFLQKVANVGLWIGNFYKDKNLMILKNITEIITNDEFHFGQFLMIYKFLVLFTNNLHIFTLEILNTAFGNDNVGDALSIIQQWKNDIYNIIINIYTIFTKAIQRQLIKDKFYHENTISHMCNNISAKLKEKDISFAKTPYDEIFAFQDDTTKMTEMQNFNYYTIAKGNNNTVKSIKREDFYIQPDLVANNTMIIDNKKNNYHYIYQNSIIKKSRNMNSAIVDFDLLRIKYNFEVNFDVTNNNTEPKNNIFKIPSEFIDISICGYDDTSLFNFRKDPEHALQIYNIDYINGENNYTLECYGYSIDFTMHDLTYVLYTQNIFTPWIDGKYEKRLYRLTCLELLFRVITGRLDEYLSTMLFSYIVTNYCITYCDKTNDQLQQIINESIIKVLSDVEHNIVNYYGRYNFDRITHIVPSVLIEPISKEFEGSNIDSKMPFSDEIIGSVVFYACLLRRHKDDQVTPFHLINKYRKDYLYFDLKDDDFNKMLQSARGYLDSIRNIFVNMFNFGQSQQVPIAGGQKKKKQNLKMKKNLKKAVSFY